MKIFKIVLIILALFIVLITALLFAFIIKPDFRLPIYKVSDQDSRSVFIDGVRYKCLPNIKWDAVPVSSKIGYAANWLTVVLEAKDDPDRNFIFLHTVGASTVYGPLYRTDKDINEPSDETVDKITWTSYVIGSNDEYVNATEDKELIKEFFSILNTGKKTNEYRSIKINSETLVIYINCTSSDLPGAFYKLNIYLSNKSSGKFVCGNTMGDYIEVPIELMEKIAGKKLDFFEKDTQEYPDDVEEEVLIYLDPDIDMFIMIDSTGWEYTKSLYEGEVYFYPKDKNPTKSITGFAISSQEKWGVPIEEVWNSIKKNLSANMNGLEWNKEESLSIGNYIGDRYHFWNSKITGDYFIWETQDLLYICSLAAEQDEYQSTYDLLIESLKSFKVPSKETIE